MPLLRQIGFDVILAFGSGSTLIALPGLMVKLETMGIASTTVRWVLPLAGAIGRIGSWLPVVITLVVISAPGDVSLGLEMLMVGAALLFITPLGWLGLAVCILILRFRGAVLRHRWWIMAAIFVVTAFFMMPTEFHHDVTGTKARLQSFDWVGLVKKVLAVTALVAQAPAALFEVSSMLAGHAAGTEFFGRVVPAEVAYTTVVGFHWIVTMFTAAADLIGAAVMTAATAKWTGSRMPDQPAAVDPPGNHDGVPDQQRVRA